MNLIDRRKWLVRWLYAAALGHLLAGIALPLFGNLAMFEGYHRFVEAAFWEAGAPAAARDQQVWWLALFGATLQSTAIWMAALVRFGERYRSPFAWGVLMLGLMVWAPQDIAISLSACNWIHVWLDGFALLTMVPPLAWLWWHDRQSIALSMTREAA